MLTYEQWRDRLFEHIVVNGSPDRPLYLFVDREDLAVAAEAEGSVQALASFTQAFQDRANRSVPFRYEYLLARSADPSVDVVPPYFLGLVMSVLAVTEAPLGAAHGVYRLFTMQGVVGA
ncbi:hypothetical protein ACI3ET_16365 [Ornithinimicrobium sp. LYQ121]|uniref:hypothetical protein n=1 Tax=Ornithinimicrobium sp. LYQ121 TaxID=3378801 RepID=UPI00385417B8